MSKLLRSKFVIGGLALVAAVFILSGCSNNSPLEPVVPQTTDMGLLGILSGSPTLVETFDVKLISKDLGGTIEIQRNAFVHLFEVPSDAIDDNTVISVKSSAEVILGKNMIVFEFGPDGLVFSKPAVLSFQMAELNARASNGKLYYLDPSSGRWVFLGSSAVAGGIAKFNINHFSKYAIGD